MSVNAFNPPTGTLNARWTGGSLVFYPSEVAGNIYYVDSNAGKAGNTGFCWDEACATVDAAVNKCTANAGDVVFIHHMHAENLAADSAVDVDVAGVALYGIQHGRQMPTFTATATAGDIKLAGAGTSIHNCRILGGIDATTGVLEVSGADCAVKNCEYRDVTGQATDALITTAAADRLLIDGWTVYGATGAGANSGIALVGADDVEIKNFYLHGNFAVGAIDCRTTASTRVRIHDGTIWTCNAADIAIVDTITASTGFIGPNLNIMLTDNAANITQACTGATFQYMLPINICNLAGELAMATNITASTDG